MIVIKNIINMVGELDMRIIAEGVESDKEMSFLRDVNCDMAQGFLFDKPMSHDDYEILLKGSRSYDK
jgi:EAL domain-containing protein (putative c-di-GMP-specific phosphodiesterase class I)